MSGVLVAGALVGVLPSIARAQDDAGRRNEVAVTVEPVAAGAQLLHTLGRHAQFGGALTLGPAYSVWFSGTDIRDWAGLYPVLALRPSPGLRVLLSPVGLAVALGNDFGAVYPSGQGGIEVSAGPLRFASLIRVVRIAGGNGSGDYQARWVPVRAAYAFRW